MDNLDKSYLEIKITVVHILILLVGVILIGIFLFYLGYQAGKSSVSELREVATQTEQQESETREISLDTGQTGEQVQSATDRSGTGTGQPTLEEEIKKQPETSPTGDAAGQEPTGQDTADQTPKEQVAIEKPENKTLAKKAVTREIYFSIQVGAFSNFANARTYSEKFGKMGYPTEILSTVKREKKMFRVRVGNFKTRAEAVKAKENFEQMEKKTFAIVRSDQ